MKHHQLFNITKLCFKIGKFKTIQLPKYLEKIDEKAFYDSNLREIEFPSTLKEIGQEAFAASGMLINVRLNAGLEKIDNEAFAFVASYSPFSNTFHIRIPSSVKIMGSSIFYCISDKEVIIDCEALSKPDGWKSDWHKNYFEKNGLLAKDTYYENINWGVFKI